MKIKNKHFKRISYNFKGRHSVVEVVEFYINAIYYVLQFSVQWSVKFKIFLVFNVLGFLIFLRTIFPKFSN